MIDTRSVLLIFRDCLKIVPKMVQQHHKVLAVRKLLRNEFEKHRYVSNPEQISGLKMNAAKGISNYLIYTIQQDMRLNPGKHDHVFEPESEEYEEETEEAGEENEEERGDHEGKVGEDGKSEGNGSQKNNNSEK